MKQPQHYNAYDVEKTVREQVSKLQDKFPGYPKDKLIDSVMRSLEAKGLTSVDRLQIAAGEITEFGCKRWRLLATGGLIILLVAGGVALWVKIKNPAGVGASPGLTGRLANASDNAVKVATNARAFRSAVKYFENQDKDSQNVKWGESIYDKKGAVDADFKDVSGEQSKGGAI